MDTPHGLIAETLYFVAQKGWTRSGEGFFTALVTFLGEKLGVEYALVDELVPGQHRARTVGLYAVGKVVPDMEYDLRGTPCENVMGKTLCWHPRGVQALFPEDVLLREMGAESYLGIPLWDSSGRALGLIAVMGQRPLVDREQAEGVLQIVAVRCAHELERRRAEEDRRKIEEQLARYQRLESVGRLAGGVAHDMNNVLTAILGVTSALREDLAHDAAVAADLDLVLNATRRGRQLVKSLTEFARGGLKDATALDLNVLLRQEAELFRRTTLSKVTVLEELEEPLPEVVGELSALSNVLMNLCTNAVDAMPEGGTLVLRSRALVGGGVEISVQDTGQGMSAEVRARAMEPFFTTKPPGKGTGLGLALVYGAMKAHGGAVELESAVGQGTRVSLRFPSARPPARTDPGSQQAGDLRPARVLLVEGEDLVRVAVTGLLRRGGHEVHTVPGGEAALALLSGGLCVDVVLLEQEPDPSHGGPDPDRATRGAALSGVETLRRLRSSHAGLPVVLVTGHVTPLLEQYAASQPGVSLLPKPFSGAELEAALQAACGTRAGSRTGTR